LIFNRQRSLRRLVIELAGVDLLLGRADRRCRRRGAQRQRTLSRYATLLVAKPQP